MNTAPRAAARSHPRTLVRWCVSLLLAAVLVQTWLLDGLIVPCRVVGDSMAETLRGVHRDVTCGDCGYRFSCGTDARPSPVRAVCPNCGYASNSLESLSDAHGDRVLIDRSAFAIRALRRWEIVAFRPARQADQLAVKRVVGLPGESIEIRGGDVYADGRIQRKNLTQQRGLAVLVHDANFQPTREPLPPWRWQAERPGSQWVATLGRFAHSAAAENEPVDWLVYHHAQRLAVEQAFLPAREQTQMSAPRARYRESPVTDLCGYNQSQPRREEDVHPVADLMLSFRLAQATGRGTLRVRASDGGDDFEWRLQYGANPQPYQVFRNGRPIREQARRHGETAVD